jgi:hypothetical protein
MEAPAMNAQGPYFSVNESIQRVYMIWS